MESTRHISKQFIDRMIHKYGKSWLKSSVWSFPKRKKKNVFLDLTKFTRFIDSRFISTVEIEPDILQRNYILCLFSVSACLIFPQDVT